MIGIIIGLFALLVLSVALAVAVVRHRDHTIANLTADVDRWQTQFRESREGKDATIAALNSNLRQLNDHDAMLQAKLEAMHLAAMRFCASARDIYYAGEGNSEVWQAKRGADKDMDSGARWYWMLNRTSRKHTSEEIASWMPTVDEWIEFANGISAHAETCSGQWWEKVRARDAVNAERANLQHVTQENVVIFARAIRKATAPLDEKALLKLSDHMLLGVLAWISKEASLPTAVGSSGWNANQVIRFFSSTLVGDAYLSVMLNDLVKHHNAEFMAVIDGMPSDIAQYFLRLTVAEPAAAAG